MKDKKLIKDFCFAKSLIVPTRNIWAAYAALSSVPKSLQAAREMVFDDRKTVAWCYDIHTNTFGAESEPRGSIKTYEVYEPLYVVFSLTPSSVSAKPVYNMDFSIQIRRI